MKKILLLLFVAAGFALTACSGEAASPAVESAGEQTADEQAGSETTTTELTVWGMTCNRCANQVINAVSASEGVVNVTVDVSADMVTIEHDPELDIDAIKSTIEAEGYNLP